MAQEQTKRGGGGGEDDDLTGSTAAGQERREKLAEETDDPLLFEVGHFMVGHGPMLSKLVEMLADYGTKLIERANLTAPAIGAAS